jgi:predicted DNA-binding mobile mystery protein A
MSVKETVHKQYIRLVDRAFDRLEAHQHGAPPAEGWIATLRKALGMSGAQLARRVGVSRAAIHQAEGNERDGVITMQQMRKLATAMGGEFVYVIVPSQHVGEVLRTRGRAKAEAIVRRASSHMALESQALSTAQNDSEIERIAEKLVRTMPSDFWDEP